MAGARGARPLGAPGRHESPWRCSAGSLEDARSGSAARPAGRARRVCHDRPCLLAYWRLVDRAGTRKLPGWDWTVVREYGPPPLQDGELAAQEQDLGGLTCLLTLKQPQLGGRPGDQEEDEPQAHDR